MLRIVLLILEYLAELGAGPVLIGVHIEHAKQAQSQRREQIPANEGQFRHEGVPLMAEHHLAGEGDRTHFWDGFENKQKAFSLWEAYAL